LSEKLVIFITVVKCILHREQLRCIVGSDIIIIVHNKHVSWVFLLFHYAAIHGLFTVWRRVLCAA